MEGQSGQPAVPRRGDPEPVVHWVAPDGRLLGSFEPDPGPGDGTLDVTITTLRDSGTFIASNATGGSHRTRGGVRGALPLMAPRLLPRHLSGLAPRTSPAWPTWSQ